MKVLESKATKGNLKHELELASKYAVKKSFSSFADEPQQSMIIRSFVFALSKESIVFNSYLL